MPTCFSAGAEKGTLEKRAASLREREISWGSEMDIIEPENERSRDHVERREDSQSGDCQDQQKGS